MLIRNLKKTDQLGEQETMSIESFFDHFDSFLFKNARGLHPIL
jgi:hypothetical protein